MTALTQPCDVCDGKGGSPLQLGTGQETWEPCDMCDETGMISIQVGECVIVDNAAFLGVDEPQEVSRDRVCCLLEGADDDGLLTVHSLTLDICGTIRTDPKWIKRKATMDEVLAVSEQNRKLLGP